MVKRLVKPLATRQRQKWLRTLLSSDASASSGGKTPPSVVIDTNVWYSAILYGGNSAKVTEFCLENCRVVASEELVEELLEHLKHKARAPYRWLRRFRILFEKICVIVPPAPEQPVVVRDPSDMHVLQAALAEHCVAIVTGDKDLLELVSYEGIAIITPAEFLR